MNIKIKQENTFDSISINKTSYELHKYTHLLYKNSHYDFIDAIAECDFVKDAFKEEKNKGNAELLVSISATADCILYKVNFKDSKNSLYIDMRGHAIYFKYITSKGSKYGNDYDFHHCYAYYPKVIKWDLILEQNIKNNTINLALNLKNFMDFFSENKNNLEFVKLIKLNAPGTKNCTYLYKDEDNTIHLARDIVQIDKNTKEYFEKHNLSFPVNYASHLLKNLKEKLKLNIEHPF